MTLTFRCKDSMWAVPLNVATLHNHEVEIVRDVTDGNEDRRFEIGAEVDGDFVTAIAFADELIIEE